MRLLVINPNTSADMTGRIATAAAAMLPAGSEIAAETGRFGATVIASRASYAIAAHAALEAYAVHAGACDAVLLACFGDPGLEALRELADVPVVGLLDAALGAAVARRQPFGIVTAGPLWRGMLAERIALGPAAALSRGVETLDMGGLAISRDPDAALAVVAAGVEALAARGAETVILGGAAMIGLAARIRAPVPLIDCLAAAVDQLAGAGVPPPRPPASVLDSRNLSAPLRDLIRASRGRTAGTGPSGR